MQRPLFDAQARDRAGDHELLDLRSALEDGVSFRVTVPTLDWVLTRLA